MHFENRFVRVQELQIEKNYNIFEYLIIDCGYAGIEPDSDKIDKNKKLFLKATFTEKKPEIKNYTNKDEIYNQAMLYFKGRHYEDAVKWFEKAANQGHVAAQVELAKMYYNGYGVDKNNENAFKWFQEAEKENHLEAQYFLGNMYEHGYGVNKNLSEAIKWYILAAEQGHLVAQHKLVECLLLTLFDSDWNANRPQSEDLLNAYEVLSDPSLDKQKLVAGMILVSHGVMINIDVTKAAEFIDKNFPKILDEDDLRTFLPNNLFENFDFDDLKLSLPKLALIALEQNKKDEAVKFILYFPQIGPDDDVFRNDL